MTRARAPERYREECGRMVYLLERHNGQVVANVAKSSTDMPDVMKRIPLQSVPVEVRRNARMQWARQASGGYCP